jgi:predicted ribosomally synthesized peptide with nif11-like leader
MKTLEEFIQRLQDDAAFEDQAQAFITGDDLMAFVQREGYDFTLEQLMEKFQDEAEPPAETGEIVTAPPDAEVSPALKPEAPVVLGQPEVSSSGEIGPACPERDNRSLTPEQPEKEVPEPPGAKPTPGPEGKSPVEWARGGGGRHRGVPLQRLKSSVGEET